jgi:acyl-CoA synthetase (AMP-forming)/AMP-acid ligase II/1-acyl-sn-glycerol-3-phosphate acyltransferase/acyl carrier protein
VLNFILRTAVRLLLSLRYRIRTTGLDEIARRGTRGILFLPNHPALIDPVILMATLLKPFRPRALADQDQVDRPLIRTLAQRIGVIDVPDIKAYGTAVRPAVEAAFTTCIDSLRQGRNLLFYPSGHIYRTRYEDLRGNSGVEDILRAAPNIRVVLVRTRGLWGSSFSLAAGEFPNVGRVLRRQIGHLLSSFLFFMPRRDVTIEFHEPADLPRHADRHTLNAYLERFYNTSAPPNTYVAYRFGESPRQSVLPEPAWGGRSGADDVPASTRNLVTEHLRGLTGVATICDEDRLAEDLGLDSLARAELLLWLAREFGSTEQDGDALVTVADVLLTARGQAVVLRPTPLTPPPATWFRDDQPTRVTAPSETTIAAAFLAAARRHPNRVVIADQLSGAKTYHDLVTGVLALKPRIERLDGDYIGIMLPASVGASVVYLATMFAGKVPVMVNWTTGARNVTHSLDLIGVHHILTSAALVAKLQTQGVDFSDIRDRLRPLEELRQQLSPVAKLGALLRSYLNWSTLDAARIADTAVVLVTSGSENLPKAVPLTHTNILTNIRDVASIVALRTNDRMLGFLPPFHSFGLTATLVAPLVLGLRAVYHANPTEAFVLTRLIASYRATMLIGTPTFLSGILRASTDARQLASLRIAVTGAEKCPETTYRTLAERCPSATVLEGYGITECSPIVSVNRLENPQPGTVGQLLPSIEFALVNVETNEPVPPGEAGMLLVRGPSIFGGYLGTDVASPFVEHAGRQWYRTGDLLSADDAGVLTFRGRLKRFIKLGGEMISLPAIEEALAPHYTTPTDEGPAIAVVATANEAQPEIVLFATRPADRHTANQQIRAAGLSPLHNIARAIQIDEIPLLGNGKTNYRELQAQLTL